MSKPNILIFMTDQEQAKVTLPNHPCKTPHLDRIAREGVRFSHVYPPMAHCCPARASFMTGLYPSQHGIYNNVDGSQAINSSLHLGVKTFSESLKDAGYQMYFSGKWHVSATETPRDRGWEELSVVRHSKPGINRREPFKEMEDDSLRTDREKGELLRPGWGSKKMYGTSQETYHETRDYQTVKKGIDTLTALKHSNDPWCLYIGVHGPHDPFIIPEKYASMYNPQDIDLPPNYNDDLKDKPAIYRRMRSIFSQFSDDEVKESIAYYWGFCTMMDDLFGEVVDALEQTGQRDDTLIMFVSDHGEHAGAHGLYAKGISHFDEGYRVPLVISLPGLTANQGRSVDEFVTLADIAPTLIDIAGAKPLNKCNGKSLVPFLRDERPQEWRDSMYTQCNGTELFYTSRSVKNKKYKFVYNPTDVDELYDLEQDPYEMVNIAGQSGMKDVRKMMYARLWKHAYETEDTIFNSYVTVATAEFGPTILNGNSNSM